MPVMRRKASGAAILDVCGARLVRGRFVHACRNTRLRGRHVRVAGFLRAKLGSVSETNGQGKSRLDRIEELIERQERANEVAHELFQAEDKRLLTAQILMNGAMQKMADGMTSLESKMEETTGKLNALIDTVDGMIRKKAE
jgi:hypothetical protein